MSDTIQAERETASITDEHPPKNPETLRYCGGGEFMASGRSKI